MKEIAEKHFKKFNDLCCRLSPENLCCDGECSRSQTNSRYAQIMREWRVLEAKVGRNVTQEEIETESIKRWNEKHP